MLSIIGLILNFFGASILASVAIKNKGQILGVSRQIVPVIKDRNADDLDTAYDKALLRMPKIKQQVRDSYVACMGLVLLAAGFGFQLISAIWC